MIYEQIGDQRYLYTDKHKRNWEVWRQENNANTVNAWAMSCQDEDMEIFDDAFWTRTSCVKQIRYLEDPDSEAHERARIQLNDLES